MSREVVSDKVLEVRDREQVMLKSQLNDFYAHYIIQSEEDWEPDRKSKEKLRRKKRKLHQRNSF